MAIPVNTVEMDLEKRKKKTNYPYVQEGNVLPMSDVAVQPPQTPPVPQVAAPASQPPRQPAPQPETYKPPTFDAQQAAALAQQPIPPPAPPATPETSKQVLGEAQQKAVGGFTSEEFNRLNELTQQFMQDPSLGRDPELAKQKAMDEFNKQRAQGFEAYRQATGGEAGLGPREESLLAMQLQTSSERAAFERDIDLQEEDRKREQLMQALAVGTGNVQLQQEIYQGDINAMIASAGGALGFAELAQRENILLSEQEYDKWKTQYTGELQTSLQSNDINAVRQNLQTQLDFEKHQAGLGRVFTSEQNALNRALESSLAHLDIDAQREFINLKASIDEGMLLQEQDFAGTENQLNRLMEQAISSDNIQAQFALQESINQFNSLMQESDQRWKTAERTATNVFAMEERISSQEYQSKMQDLDNRHQIALQANDIRAKEEIEAERSKLQLTMQAQDQKFTDAQQYLQRQHETAIQSKDIDAQKNIAQMQVDLELTMQTKDMAHDEKMTYLDSELQEARDQGNFEREKQLLNHQTELNWQTMEKDYGYQEAQMNLQQEIDQALQDDNQEFAMQLEEIKWKHEMQMHQDNIVIQQARLALEEKGLNMAQVEQEYNMIMDQIDQGAANPGDGLKFLNKKIAEAGGVPIEGADPNAWQKSIQEDFLMQQYQWALSQGDPNDVSNFGPDGEFLGLKNEFQEQFNNHLNNTFYGTDDTPEGQKITEFKKGEDDAVAYFSGKTKGDPTYQALLSDNTTKTWDGVTKTVGKGSSKRSVFVNMPQVGGFMQYNGTIFRLDGKKTINDFGTDFKEYKVTNILTGETVYISTGQSNQNIADKLGG